MSGIAGVPVSSRTSDSNCSCIDVKTSLGRLGRRGARGVVAATRVEELLGDDRSTGITSSKSSGGCCG
jgi:hypothetical protein